MNHVAISSWFTYGQHDDHATQRHGAVGRPEVDGLLVDIEDHEAVEGHREGRGADQAEQPVHPLV